MEKFVTAEYLSGFEHTIGARQNHDCWTEFSFAVPSHELRKIRLGRQ